MIGFRKMIGAIGIAVLLPSLSAAQSAAASIAAAGIDSTAVAATDSIAVARRYSIAAGENRRHHPRRPVPKLPPEAIYPNFLTTEDDSMAMAQIQAKMAQIKKTRPTVAVVLSGGGAKGAAHIGALKYLESIDMPIDMILGTSMGGLVGGFYALGYSAAQMDSIIRSVDWGMLMSDRVPREYISYAETKYKEKYVLSIPFYYDTEYYKELLEDEMKYVDTQRYDEPLNLGADSGGSSDFIKKNILGSLPSGYYFGQNIYNLISGLSVGYQDSLDFGELPIPFACVATELVSGVGKYWLTGSLATALRSTMSIPGVFAPVKVDGMVLVDGGMRDNFPTTLARQMGADYVIGVEVSTDRRQYNEINNIGDIINQGIDMLGRSVYEYNMTVSNINIHPELEEYNMMSFDEKSIDDIIYKGYLAAYQNEAKLLNIKKIVGDAGRELKAPEAVDINKDAVIISDVDIRGVSPKEKGILMRKIKLEPGDKVTKSDIEHIVAEIYGTQCYDYVTYELSGTGEPYALIINCKPGPVHQLGVGLRLDTEELVSVLLNVGLNAHRIRGSKYDFTGRVSINPYFKFHYTYDAPKVPTLNATASVKWTDMNIFDVTASRLNMSYLDVRQELYISNLKWSMFDVNFGVRNQYINVRSLLSSEFILGDYDLAQLSNDYVSAFLNARGDTFDDGYFPTGGYSLGLSYNWTFAGFPTRINNFHAVALDGKVLIPCGRVFSIIPSFNCRFLFGRDVPLSYMNVLGGSFGGRYFDQQMPFVGITTANTKRNILTVFRSDFRFRLAKNHYLTGIVNYARDCDDFTEYTHGLGYFGAGVEYGFDAFFGPVSANLHWSDITDKLGFYINIGYWF